MRERNVCVGDGGALRTTDEDSFAETEREERETRGERMGLGYN